MAKEKEKFICVNCEKENHFDPNDYTEGTELFLEAAGEPTTKEVVINCKYCKKENMITITL